MTFAQPDERIGNQITDPRYHSACPRARRPSTRSSSSARSDPDPERRLHVTPSALGGLRQRVTIAIALACGPRSSSPTSDDALDVTVQAQILDLLAAQQRERSMG